MAYKKADAANLFLRAVLNLVGENRDSFALGLAPGELRDKKLKSRIREEFENKCAYCGVAVGEDAAKAEIDHLVPINKASLGLQMLGNQVLSCHECNSAKKSKSLEEFLKSRPDLDAKAITTKLWARQEQLGANQDTQALRDFAENLYQEISSLVEIKVADALALLTEVSIETKKAAANIQRKANYDFSEIAQLFPIGCTVNSSKDNLRGEVMDYSLQGPKGQRTAYVTFIDESSGVKYRRARATLTRQPS